MKTFINKCFLVTAFFSLAISTLMQGQQSELNYQSPPKVIENLILAPATPILRLSPDNKRFAILEYTDIPDIYEQSKEELRLAGVRVLPDINAPKVKTKIKRISIENLPGNNFKEGKIVGFANDVNILDVSWSPLSNKLAALVEDNDGVRLWIIDADNLEAKQLSKDKMNLFFGIRNYRWSPCGNYILAPFTTDVKSAISNNDKPIILPVVQSSESAVKKPARTYQDLLTDKASEIAFEKYATAQLKKIDVNTYKAENVQNPQIFTSFGYSPNGKYLMLSYIKAPYSYFVPYRNFPSVTKVIDIQGSFEKILQEKSLVESDNLNRNSTVPFSRSFAWRADKPSTIYWIDPLDGGNGLKPAEFRDEIKCMDIAEGNVYSICKTKYRFESIVWGNSDNAFVNMYDYPTRTKACIHISPAANSTLGQIYNIHKEDLYSDKGKIVTSLNSFGREVAYTADNYKTIWFSSNGYSPKGAYPYIDQYTFKGSKWNTVWKSADPYYQRPIDFINLAKGIMIVQKEAETIAPNYFLVNFLKKSSVQLTNFADPFPEMKGVTKQVVEYTRKDGVNLSGTLYLPAGYKKEDGPLPLIIWAYPAEFKSKDNAGQRSDAANQFIRYSRLSPVLFVADGYAVLNNASFPIIGEDGVEPNDTYIEQLVDNAKAAVDKVVSMGVADKNRIAVSGHSYGGFMTANLLANCDLFAAGIARSGAYNRTLTPFGFQNETRTLWDVPNVYLEMSPFMKADKVNTPILLIHGMADNNTGTFTMQSERLYTALKGNGKVARLVLLPYESHAYVAKESMLHQAYETWRWLDKYVKNRNDN